jgi:catechol 2,3-dioxygenase-like lactoylglutathione lyase family enzyme
MALFRGAMILSRDLPKTLSFYTNALGLSVNLQTDAYAELGHDSCRLMVKAAAPQLGEAVHSVGYTPFLCFTMSSDHFDTAIYKALQQGAILDGPIKYPEHGKVATLRSPDGHMISLVAEPQ